ncbi:MAG: 50S ribosomal protein L28 [Chloroflexi bacterium]|nr:50S ribosomal protein L28 [Chloroflexota bacterium]
MTGRCELCGRGPQFGHNVSHAENRTLRRWQLNLHRSPVVLQGRARRMIICSRCLRSLQKGVAAEKLLA